MFELAHPLSQPGFSVGIDPFIISWLTVLQWLLRWPSGSWGVVFGKSGQRWGARAAAGLHSESVVDMFQIHALVQRFVCSLKAPTQKAFIAPS